MVKYCTSDELALHNHEGSLWVAIFGHVLDLSDLVAKNSGDETRVLVEAAGQDISHWFTQNQDGQVDIKTHIHPVTLLPAPFLPLSHHHQHNYSIINTSTSTTTTSHSAGSSSASDGNGTTGKILHVPPPCPRSDYSTDFGMPWWRDTSLVSARLTNQPRKIKIINTLTSQEHILDVCGEETMEDIKTRYLDYNKHANSYEWKRLGVPLDMQKTLEENGIKDEREVFAELGVNDEMYIPAIHLYFIDDLTFE